MARLPTCSICCAAASCSLLAFMLANQSAFTVRVVFMSLKLKPIGWYAAFNTPICSAICESRTFPS